MTISPEDIIKLLLAVLAGGAIGMERELHHKAAGFRTITLICIGATLLTILDARMGGTGRIAANIVTGIGFLGAGVILHDVSRIKGLTTAATVWMSAALGMGIGAGAYLQTLVAVVVVLGVMVVFFRIEHWLDSLYDTRHYQIVLPCDPQKVAQVEAKLRSSGLRIGFSSQMKRNGKLICNWDASGPTQKQNDFVHNLLPDPEVLDLQW